MHRLTYQFKARCSLRAGALVVVFTVALASVVVFTFALATPATAARPEYEQAYVGGTTVTINAISVPSTAPLRAQADFYAVVCPVDWQARGLNPPQCNPCDHNGNGIDAFDFHDHVLDSMPGNPGHGEFSPLWHLFFVMPNYTGDAAHDAAVGDAYAAALPTKSEAAVDALLAQRLGNGSPVAVEIDAHGYFLCAVVSANAGK
jgi:hypothetical protein